MVNKNKGRILNSFWLTPEENKTIKGITDKLIITPREVTLIGEIIIKSIMRQRNNE